MKYVYFVGLFIGFLFLNMASIAQSPDESYLKNLPYYEIPDYPDDYTPGSVAARIVDGLGYRYYWATEGLRPEDLAYSPSDDIRSIREILDHIYRLTRTIALTTKQVPIEPLEEEDLAFEELRARTLQYIEEASMQLKGKPQEALDAMEVVFKREDRTSSYPFWNLLNGPINDAVYHTGQVVTFRRASGNPLDFRVSFFRGKNKE